MSDNSDLLTFLPVAQNRVEHQHNVLWKVETHYTWFVYVIAGVLISVLFFAHLELKLLKILVPVFGGLGIIMSIIGYYVIRLEGEYLAENRNIYQKTLEGLPKIKALHPCQEQKPKEWLDTRADANKCFVLLLINFILYVPMSVFYMFLYRKLSIKMSDWLYKCFKIRIGVRDLFQITMLIAFVLFVVAIIFIYSPLAKELIPLAKEATHIK